MSRVGVLVLSVASALAAPVGTTAQSTVAEGWGDPALPVAAATDVAVATAAQRLRPTAGSLTLTTSAPWRLTLRDEAPDDLDLQQARARNRGGVPLMVGGGVLFVAGAIAGGDVGAILMLGGAGVGAYGAYLYFGG